MFGRERRQSGDHDPADLPETPLVRSWGGQVVVVPYRTVDRSEGDAVVAAATLR